MTEFICVECGCSCGTTGSHDDGTPWGVGVTIYNGNSYCEDCFEELKKKEAEKEK